jgi:hypothetical protein
MTALRIARIALLTSIAVYGVTLLLLAVMNVGDPGLLILLSLAASIAVPISAIACIVLQIRAAILSRRTQSGSPGQAGR